VYSVARDVYGDSDGRASAGCGYLSLAARKPASRTSFSVRHGIDFGRYPMERPFAGDASAAAAGARIAAASATAHSTRRSGAGGTSEERAIAMSLPSSACDASWVFHEGDSYGLDISTFNKNPKSRIAIGTPRLVCQT